MFTFLKSFFKPVVSLKLTDIEEVIIICYYMHFLYIFPINNGKNFNFKCPTFMSPFKFKTLCQDFQQFI